MRWEQFRSFLQHYAWVVGMITAILAVATGYGPINSTVAIVMLLAFLPLSFYLLICKIEERAKQIAREHRHQDRRGKKVDS